MTNMKTGLILSALLTMLALPSFANAAPAIHYVSAGASGTWADSISRSTPTSYNTRSDFPAACRGYRVGKFENPRFSSKLEA
jgi:hypothetical protein